MNEEMYVLGKKENRTSSSLNLLLLSGDWAPGERHRDTVKYLCRGRENVPRSGGAEEGWVHINAQAGPQRALCEIIKKKYIFP